MTMNENQIKSMQALIAGVLLNGYLQGHEDKPLDTSVTLKALEQATIIFNDK